MPKQHVITEIAVVMKEEAPNSGKYILSVAHQGIDNERCATCRMCADKSGKKIMRAVLGEGVEKSKIVPGAEVLVEIKIPVIYAHILFVFVLPIVGFIGGASVGYALFGAEGVRSLIPVGLGLLGAILLFLAGKPLFSEKVTRREDPVIVGIADRPGEK